MILVDSNIIIDFWKHPTEEMKEVFATGDVVICGVVRSEILHGAVSQENLDRLSKLLNAFDIVSIKDDQWDGFGRYLYKLKTNGLTVPYQDALISYIAVQNYVKVWTRDKHFKLMQVIEPNLQLFDESQS